MDASIIQIVLGTLGTIAVALITSLVSWRAVRLQERRQSAKDETDRAAAINDMALELLEPYKDQLAEMRGQIAEQKKLIEDLRCDVKTERDRRKELEQVVREKDDRIATMQIELDRIPTMQAEIDVLKKQLARMHE